MDACPRCYAKALILSTATCTQCRATFNEAEMIQINNRRAQVAYEAAHPPRQRLELSVSFSISPGMKVGFNQFVVLRVSVQCKSQATQTLLERFGRQHVIVADQASSMGRDYTLDDLIRAYETPDLHNDYQFADDAKAERFAQLLLRGVEAMKDKCFVGTGTYDRL